MADQDISLYDVLKAVENVYAETKSVSNRLDKIQLDLSDFKSEMNEFKDEMYEFKEEMHEFKDEMYEFKDEMHEFKEKTDEQLNTLNQKVSESLNGMETLQERVWSLEKQRTY